MQTRKWFTDDTHQCQEHQHSMVMRELILATGKNFISLLHALHATSISILLQGSNLRKSKQIELLENLVYLSSMSLKLMLERCYWWTSVHHHNSSTISGGRCPNSCAGGWKGHQATTSTSRKQDNPETLCNMSSKEWGSSGTPTLFEGVKTILDHNSAFQTLFFRTDSFLSVCLNVSDRSAETGSSKERVRVDDAANEARRTDQSKLRLQTAHRGPEGIAHGQRTPSLCPSDRGQFKWHTSRV